MTSFSEATQTTYESWEALVEAEASGWVVVAIITEGASSWPWIVGPYGTKRDASNARARARNRWQRAQRARPTDHTASFFVRAAWKDVPR